MKTLYLICTVAGMIVISVSCKIFHKAKSKESPALEKNAITWPSHLIDSTRLFNIGLSDHLDRVMKYAEQHRYSTEYFFFIDMGISSGKNRFFVFDTRKDSVTLSGLVSHGSCNSHYLEQARFSNNVNCGCSSLGRYKVGSAYRGEFGKAYKLYGLDSSNSNAFKRGIVLHSFGPIPDNEIYPNELPNSFGCPMVSRSFLVKLSDIIDNSQKPILLWVYD